MKQKVFSTKQPGFTLIEVVVVVVLAVIVLALAIPSFSSLIQSSRIAADTSALSSDLNFARSEAVKRRADVALCSSTDGANCNTDDWGAGWLIYLDANTNQAFEGPAELCPPTPTALSDCFLRMHAAVNDGNDIATQPIMSQLVFRPDGSLRGVAVTEQLHICTSRTVLPDRERLISVELSGHVDIQPYTCP